MSAELVELKEDCASTLRAYLHDASESALERAYELGRRALAQGVGVLEVAQLQHSALADALRQARSPEEGARAAAAAESLLVESLSPFEMTHRASRDALMSQRRLNETLEAEARRIAHALHDEAGQLLASVYIALDSVARDLTGNARTRLLQIRELLDQVEAELRRLSHGLRPTILDDFGLRAALESLVQTVSARTGIDMSVAGDDVGRLPGRIEIALYRIAQEALTNVVRHARAGHASIVLTREDERIRCVIKDDGVGFPAGAPDCASQGLGLVGIRERLKALGGSLEIRSEAGQGTELIISAPL